MDLHYLRALQKLRGGKLAEIRLQRIHVTEINGYVNNTVDNYVDD